MNAPSKAWRGAWVATPAALLLIAFGQVPPIPIISGSPPATQPTPQEDFPQPGAALFEDLGTDPDAAAVWGRVDCEQRRRHRLVTAGGDTATRAAEAAGDNSSFRRLRLSDGDDVFGERCELGLNDHRESPTGVYREGERVLTFMSLRLPPHFPLAERSWQVVMQMKQSQPSDAGGGPPMLAMHARAGRWRVVNNSATELADGRSQIWSAPARRGAWVRFAFEIVYSVDPERGSVRIYADLDRDGDVSEPSERSRRIAAQTLKRETVGSGADGLYRGDSIPSHLRVGLYHDTAIGCRPGRCRIDVDNVGIYQP